MKQKFHFQGIAGKQGIPGPRGPQGVPGTPGRDGSPGSAGLKGERVCQLNKNNWKYYIVWFFGVLG